MGPYFDSLKDLIPDEICFVDTTPDPVVGLQFLMHLYKEAQKIGIKKIKTMQSIWDGDYSKVKNLCLDMSESDWVLFLDSDEMLTNEAAHSLRKTLEGLPEETLVLRPRVINLLDDNRFFGGLWKKGVRPPITTHGRIVRRGYGRWERKEHEVYTYPGRTEIPWNSPRHPKKDWFGHYLLHLWFYKDAPMRRADWSTHTQFDMLPAINGDYEESKAHAMKQRGWKAEPIPEDITWKKINWKVDPSQWKIKS